MRGRSLWPMIGALLITACRDHTPTVGAWEQGEGFRWRALDVGDAALSARDASAGFTALTPSRTGVTHAYVLDAQRALTNRDLLIGAGVAAGDIDGDGYPELFAASVSGRATLYRNRGGFSFEDVTVSSGMRIDRMTCEPMRSWCSALRSSMERRAPCCRTGSIMQWRFTEQALPNDW